MKTRGLQKRGWLLKVSLSLWIFLLGFFPLSACTSLESAKSDWKSDQRMERRCQRGQSEESQQKEAQQRTKALLGVLKERVTQQEEARLLREVAEVQELEKTEGKYPPPSSEKKEKIQEINRYVDKLTKKYFPGWRKAQKEWDESYESEVYEKEGMLQILETKLSAEDYKKFQEMYSRWRIADTRKKERESKRLYRTMREVLLRYPDLDADLIMEDLTDLFTKTWGVFVREKEGTFSYQAGEKRALPQLSQEEQEECQEYIRRMQKVLPPQAVACFDTITIFTDETAGTCAYVNLLDQEATRWNLSIDKADMDDPGEFCYTAVHEYAHYLSLNRQQVRYHKGFVASDAPSVYRDDTVEAREGSYIQAYYEAFWRWTHEDRMANQESILFYLRHHQEFISSYAATDCVEDFAETFAWYVLDDKVQDPLVQQKIDFFKAYPALEKEKECIRSRMKQYQIQPEKYDPEYEDWKHIMGE